jgi:2-isopropylmalate synthase
MGEKKIYIFDTTLRDGTQGEGISFSVLDKILIARKLDEFGIDYIEGGWPGSNPKDMEFFREIKRYNLRHSKIVAFGSTRRASNSAENDLNIKTLLEADTPAVAIFGKSWILHAKTALGVSPEENLRIIYDSVAYLKSNGREVIYDAEHFFDGFKDDRDYAIRAIKSAEDAGADTIVLCDTNGGTLTLEIVEIISEVKKHVDTPLGIHAHNDSGLAVANSVAAVQAGVVHVQGTINGFGERCGNANLITVVPNLQIKGGYRCVPDEALKNWVSLSRFVYEIANIVPPNNDPYVGISAFAHKGGVHVSAVMKDSRTYEHIDPELVGNRRRVLVSDLSGRSNVVYKSGELGIEIKDGDLTRDIVQKLKELEHNGYQFEGAEASFELLVRNIKGEEVKFFELKGFRVVVEKGGGRKPCAEATIKLIVNGKLEHTAAEGNGPVNALDNALRKALEKFFPEIKEIKLTDYKVRVINGSDGTAAKVRVLIESTDGSSTWGTVGVSENIIEASWQALVDSISYKLLKSGIISHMGSF